MNRNVRKWNNLRLAYNKLRNMLLELLEDWSQC